MKILFINTGPWGTGSFTAIKGLSKELLQQGHEVKIFFPDAHLETVDMDEYYSDPGRYHIWNFPISNGSITLPTFPLMLTDPHPRNPYPILFNEMTDEEITFYNAELCKELTALIESFQPDIIECHHIWYASWVLHQMGRDYIVTAHHSDQMGFQRDLKVQAYAISGAEAAKKILAISEPVKQEVIQLYHVPESKVVVCENGYDKTVFKKMAVDRQSLLEKLGLEISPDATLITFVGKISLNKGVDIILRANNLLDPQLNIHFIMMGAGDIEPILEALPPGSYDLNRLHFVDHQPPEIVAALHNISKLSIMPSRSEGFGIACLEAMACGLPTVVTKSGGPEGFAVGEIIDKNSPTQLANAISNLLNLSEGAYQALSEQACTIASKFSWCNILKKHLQVYEEVLSKAAEEA